MKIVEHFSSIEDPRVERTKKHPLVSILAIAVLATICGGEGWSEMAEYGVNKALWLKGFLHLPNGIPSEDTFARVLSRINPKEFYGCFTSFMEEMVCEVNGKVIAIDGKTVRRSHNKRLNRKPLHLVSAWVTEHSVLLGQVATEEKSNEIKAIPELLDLIEISGAIITIDAQGTQKSIAKKIIDKEADYILQLKGNHPKFFEGAKTFFEGIGDGTVPTDDMSSSETVDGDHGRIETRKAISTSNLEWFKEKHLWPGLKSITRMERTRETPVYGEEPDSYKVQHEFSYYISSLPADSVALSRAIRLHWGVENGLHWCLDVAFHEDLSRVRKDHGPENLALLRKIALNLLKSEKTLKRGLATKRRVAGWNNEYLLKVLSV